MKKSLLTACALLSLCLTAGCASKPKEEPKTAEGLYVQAKEYMDKTSYAKSAETFEKIELEHPYSALATKAKLMGAYAYYKDQKYDDAILAIDRFMS